MKHLKGFPDLPPVWALAMLLLSWGLSVWFPILVFPVSYWLAGAFVLAGFALIGWAAWFFFEQATPIMPREKPQTLLIAGPFRINRNPIYTGMLLILAGAAVAFGSFAGWLPVLAFPIIITERFIKGEEDGLRAAFPDEAERYLRESRRW